MIENDKDIVRTLYVSDLDGTLLGEDSQLSAVTVATLNRIIGELGGLFTVATARTPATVVPLMQEVHARLPFIVIGGSAMWNPVTCSYEHTRGIDDKTVNAVADVFGRHGAHPFIYRRHGSMLHAHHYGPISPQEERFVAERCHLSLKKFILDDGSDLYKDTESYNPLLLIKDFNAHGFTTDEQLMSNADVPTISFEGLVENPVNPFTGKPINNDEKYAHPQKILTEHFADELDEFSITKLTDGLWLQVEKDMRDPNNWTVLEDNR